MKKIAFVFMILAIPVLSFAQTYNIYDQGFYPSNRINPYNFFEAGRAAGGGALADGIQKGLNMGQSITDSRLRKKELELRNNELEQQRLQLQYLQRQQQRQEQEFLQKQEQERKQKRYDLDVVLKHNILESMKISNNPDIKKSVWRDYIKNLNEYFPDHGLNPSNIPEP